MYIYNDVCVKEYVSKKVKGEWKGNKKKKFYDVKFYDVNVTSRQFFD